MSDEDPGFRDWNNKRQGYGFMPGTYDEYQSSVVAPLIQEQQEAEEVDFKKSDLVRAEAIQSMGPVQVPQAETVTP